MDAPNLALHVLRLRKISGQQEDRAAPMISKSCVKEDVLPPVSDYGATRMHPITTTSPGNLVSLEKYPPKLPHICAATKLLLRDAPKVH